LQVDIQLECSEFIFQLLGHANGASARQEQQDTAACNSREQ